MIDDGDLIDYALGEGDAAQRAHQRAEIAGDIEAATGYAEVRDLVDRMRSLTVVPTGRVPLAVRYALVRRRDLRAVPVSTPRERLRLGLAVAAAALAWLWISVFAFGPSGRKAPNAIGEEFAIVDALPFPRDVGPRVARAPRDVEVDAELASLLDASSLPVGATSFARAFERFASQPVPDGFGGWLSAENRIAHLRAEFTLRFSASARSRARTATGSPDVDDRVARLADTVAARTGARLLALESGPGDVDVAELAIAMRSLLASGSTTEVGEHREIVAACLRLLANRLPQLDGAALATSLSALSELAVAEGGAVADLVATHADRMARETLRRAGDGRPGLLHWRSPLSSLADAGQVLALAPAFGVHGGLAFRARLMIAAHIDERIALHEREETPELTAAMLYGFGDLIDRRAADWSLMLWRPRALRSDYVAMFHVAWGKYPVRSGWADFQRELAGLAALPTPDGIRDSAALLLCLSVNAAAPGVLVGPVSHSS